MPFPDLPLRTDRLDLRRFEVDDLDAYLAYQGREDVARYMLYDAMDRPAAAVRLQQAMTSLSLDWDDDTVDLAVVRRDTGQLVGNVLLFLRNRKHQMGEIGFAFHPDHHRQGFAREAATRMLQVAFEDLGWHRVIGRCDARNQASAGLMRSLGMREEAHFVRNEWVKDEWCDELVYALLEDEWPMSHEEGG